LKINRIMPFCNLFMGRPSYYYYCAPPKNAHMVGDWSAVNRSYYIP